MRTFILFGIVVALLFLIAATAAARWGYLPTTADVTPPSLETRLAGGALNASIARHAPRPVNPLPATDANLIRGMKIYTMNCAVCHGTLDRKPSPLEHSFYPPPPQLLHFAQGDPEWRVYYIVRTGIRYTGMPAWNHALSDEEMWQVTAFLTRAKNLPPSVQDYWKSSFGVAYLP